MTFGSKFFNRNCPFSLSNTHSSLVYIIEDYLQNYAYFEFFSVSFFFFISRKFEKIVCFLEEWEEGEGESLLFSSIYCNEHVDSPMRIIVECYLEV